MKAFSSASRPPSADFNTPDTPPSTPTVAAAIATSTGRGWRLDKAARDAQIGAVIALAMAVERAEHVPAPVKVLGWL